MVVIHTSELKKAGLSDREVAVYLALLTLGPSPVQVIARKAKVARGTTYVILEQLRRRNLAAVQVQRQRRFFIAEPPEQLLAMLETEQRTLQHRMAGINRLLPTLRAIMHVHDHARYYEGREGLQAMRQEMVMYCQPHDMWYNLAPIEDLQRLFGKEGIVCLARIKKGITSRTICLTRSESLRRKLSLQASRHHTERKFVFLGSDSPSCGLTVFRDRVAIGNFGGALSGMIIENRALTDLLKKFFDIVWSSLS